MRKNKTNPEPSQGKGSQSRKIKLPSNSRLNKHMIRELDMLFQFAPPNRLLKHLRMLLLNFIYHEHDLLPIDFKQMMEDMMMLFEWMDVCEGH